MGAGTGERQNQKPSGSSYDAIDQSQLRLRVMITVEISLEGNSFLIFSVSLPTTYLSIKVLVLRVYVDRAEAIQYLHLILSRKLLLCHVKDNEMRAPAVALNLDFSTHCTVCEGHNCILSRCEVGTMTGFIPRLKQISQRQNTTSLKTQRPKADMIRMKQMGYFEFLSFYARSS